MRTIIILIILTATLVLPPSSGAVLTISDESCMSAPGQWIGNMCPVANTNGSVVDCTNMNICNRPTGGTCTQNPTQYAWECILPNGTRVPCGFDICSVTVPTCEADGGIMSPLYRYRCSLDNIEYDKIDLCQNACGGACECPNPGLYNQSISLCQYEPTIECVAPYTFDTTYYECIVDRVCPAQTAWDDAYAKCIGDPIWQCTNATYTYQATTNRCEKTPPDCPTSTTTPPLWEPTFLTNGKCTTTQDHVCSGAPSYTYTGGPTCTAGSPTCSQGTYDTIHDRCEVSHTAPTCDTANGYSYDAGSAQCVKTPPTCSAGSWNYSTHRCEQATTPGPATCDINGYTYPDYATCQANCSNTTYATCNGGGFSPAGVNYYYGSATITVTGSGNTLNIGGSVSNLGTGVTASGSCTVSTISGSYITASGSSLTFGSCTITFTGVSWNPGSIHITYPPCSSPNGASGFTYTLAISGNVFAWSAYADWGSYTESCAYGVSSTGGSYGTCPYTGQPCTGPTCSQTTTGTCTQAGGTCSAGWTISGSICYQAGTCPAGGTYDPNNNRCYKAATNPCPVGMTYDGSHSPTVCQMAAYCPPGGSLVSDQCQSSYTLVCPTNYPSFDSASSKCYTDPVCPDGTYDPNPGAKLCWQMPVRVCPNPTQTTYDPVLDKCTAELNCPAPGAFDPVINKCILVGTASCQAPYTYDSANHRCTYTPPCTPSDWMCPADSGDPVCNNTAPIMKKTWIELGTGTTDSSGHYTPPPTYTFATFTTPMTQPVFETTAGTYGAHPADITYRDTIINNFGSGPFWITSGVLYSDVFFNTTSCSSYTDYASPTRTWRPKDYPTVGCANWPNIWERYETACLCTQFTQDTYTRTCSATPPYYTEALTTTTVPVNTSTCTGTPLNCTAGLAQEGINQCTGTVTTYGSYISCPPVVIAQTRTVKTCATQVASATFPVETRTIPTSNYGIMQWDSSKCTPCQAYNDQTVIPVPEPPLPPEPPPFDPSSCTNFKIFNGTAKKCHERGMESIFTDCCQLSGWFPNWCEQEEKELKKRRLAKTCHEVGEYCSKRIRFLFVRVCVQKKKTYCCFSSKLSRILNEQIRPQLSRGFGSPESPDCIGFTPEEFSSADFSQVDLSEYVSDIAADTGKAASDITKGLQEWIIDATNPPPATKKE